jgi:hypothetical protein
LPISDQKGCICTSPNWRVFYPDEQEYLIDSTIEDPIAWIKSFYNRGEKYRFRGEFFTIRFRYVEMCCISDRIFDSLDKKFDDFYIEFKPTPIHDMGKEELKGDRIQNVICYNDFLSVKISDEVKKSIENIKKKIKDKSEDERRTILQFIEFELSELLREIGKHDLTSKAGWRMRDELQGLIYKVDEIKKNFVDPKKPKYTEQMYAMATIILYKLGKIDPLIDISSRKALWDYGKRRWGTGEQFCKTFEKIKNDPINVWVRSLTEPKRRKWKEQIIDITGNDADVISYLKKQPN